MDGDRIVRGYAKSAPDVRLAAHTLEVDLATSEMETPAQAQISAADGRESVESISDSPQILDGTGQPAQMGTPIPLASGMPEDIALTPMELGMQTPAPEAESLDTTALPSKAQEDTDALTTSGAQTPYPYITAMPIQTQENSDAMETPDVQMAFAVQESPFPQEEGGTFTGGALLFIISAAVIIILCGIILLVRRKGRMRKEPEDAYEVNDRTSASGCQIVGSREHQEDAFGVSDVNDLNLCRQRGILAVVADGVGGLDDGQVASRQVVQCMAESFYHGTASMPGAIRLLTYAMNAHENVVQIRQSRGVRCGSTLVAALIEERNLYFISIGDSRIMLYRGGGLITLNREHKAGVSMEERRARGEVNLAERKPGVLTSYMGKEDLREIDRNTVPIHLLSGDQILLMSDGVYNALTEDEIIARLTTDARISAQGICDAISEKQISGQDNATVVVIRIG